MTPQRRVRVGTMACSAVLAALAAPAAGQIVTNNTEYTCANAFDIPRSHNLSLEVTVRSLHCSTTAMSVGKWYDLRDDPDLMHCAYTHLECVDFSVWSSENPGPQDVFVRVYEDLTPDDGMVQSGSLMLLGEDIVTLPASAEGVAAGSPGRTDGDLSVSLSGAGGDGVLVSTASAIFVEVGHLGESRTRLGCNDAGEIGDEMGGQEQTWVRSPGCNLGLGIPSDWSKWIDVASIEMDFVQQIHIRNADEGTPPMLPSCPEDIDRDGAVEIDDFLTVLGTWGLFKGCSFPTRPAGDVFPSDRGNNLVDIDDFLAVLGAWGPCPGQ